MSWASYDTPLGPAGYAHEDTCREPGCNEKIDRGLAHLCGDTPGRPDEYGCGEWFCGWHLFGLPAGVEIAGGLCRRCLDAWVREHPDCPECGAEEAKPHEEGCTMIAAAHP